MIIPNNNMNTVDNEYTRSKESNNVGNKESYSSFHKLKGFPRIIGNFPGPRQVIRLTVNRSYRVTGRNLSV